MPGIQCRSYCAVGRAPVSTANIPCTTAYSSGLPFLLANTRQTSARPEMQTTRRKHRCRCNPKHATTCCKRRSGCSRIVSTQQQTLLRFPTSPTELSPTQRRNRLYLRRLVDLITLEPTSATACSTLSVAAKPYAKRVDKHLDRKSVV